MGRFLLSDRHLNFGQVLTLGVVVLTMVLFLGTAAWEAVLDAIRRTLAPEALDERFLRWDFDKHTRPVRGLYWTGC